MKRFALMCLGVSLITGCARLPDLYSAALASLNRGDLSEALTKAKQGAARSAVPTWTWKFKWIQAEVYLQQRNGAEARKLLSDPLSPAFEANEIGVMVHMDRGYAAARLRDFDAADADFKFARQHAAGDLLGEVAFREGIAALLRKRPSDAERYFRESLDLARHNRQEYLEACDLAYLGAIRLDQRRWGAVIDFAGPSVALSRKLSIKTLLEKNLGNLAEANLKMGDMPTALSQLEEAQSIAREIGMTDDRATIVMKMGAVYNARNEYAKAADYYKEALALSTNKGDVARALQNLSVAAFDSKDYDAAKKYNEQATNQYRANKDTAGLLYSRYVHAYLNTRMNQNSAAEEEFSAIIHETKADLSLRRQAQLALARVHVAQSRTDLAEHDFQEVIKTIDQARRDLGRDEFKMLFRSQLNSYYNEYIQLLMKQGKHREAFQVSELSRAQVLSEKLGLAAASPVPVSPVPDAVLLSYWLGPDTSYLWAATPAQFSAFVLPKASEIAQLVEEYQRAIASAGNVRESANLTGLTLFQMLVGPARDYLSPGARVIVVPDGALQELNFETLLVPGKPLPHYWIEDVVLSTATSVALLRPHPRENRPANLLVIGNPQQAVREYAPLPNAATEVLSLAGRFPADRETILQGAAARPSAYRNSHPEQFSWIHFAAHGIADKDSPLDSAVVLSREGESFKLYARDIAALPLTADLVTISACYGSGLRNYSGEGLVGLAWAFLLAGAHNVIASLWEVNDYYTPQLMDAMYRRLQAGDDPAHALRAAKLTLLHQQQYVCRNPRYWGPFQLYAGL